MSVVRSFCVLTFLETKLLKPGTTYGIGRHNDSPLWVNSKKVSRQNGEIIVAEHSQEDSVCDLHRFDTSTTNQCLERTFGCPQTYAKE